MRKKGNETFDKSKLRSNLCIYHLVKMYKNACYWQQILFNFLVKLLIIPPGKR